MSVLTDFEKDVIKLLAKGMKVNEISTKLDKKPAYVYSRIQVIQCKITQIFDEVSWLEQYNLDKDRTDPKRAIEKK